MNKLILCEGQTDAILLSYYLEQTCGWKHSKKGPSRLSVKADEKSTQSVEWYQRDDDFLLICAVGSKNGFRRFFDEKIIRPLVDADAFSKIALIIDRDDEEVEDIEATIQRDLPMIANKAKNTCWVSHEYENGYREVKTIDFLLQIIPHEQQGALESLLLEAISEDEYDRNIVSKSCSYVDSIAPEADRYIGKRRLILKAYLGVTWAIQSPQKVFSFIDEQIRMVKWEKSKILAECFSKIREI